MSDAQKYYLRNLAASLSFANLCYARIWSESLTYTRSDAYLMKSPPSPEVYLSAMAGVLAIGSVFWGASILYDRVRSRTLRRFLEFVFLASFLIPINAFRQTVAHEYRNLGGILIRELGPVATAVIVVACVVVFLAIVARWTARAAWLAKKLLIVSCAFIPVTFGQAIWKATHYDASEFVSETANHGADKTGLASAARVIWIIFDELDQRIVFEARPSEVRLPEFDSFRERAIYAGKAYSVRGAATLVAMPALTTGKDVWDATAAGPDDLQLQFQESGPKVSWKKVPTIFSEAAEAGYRAALLGWYHPYCRLFGSVLYRCDWCEMPRISNSMGSEPGQLFVNQMRSIVETSLFSPFGQSLTTRTSIEVFHHQLEKAIEYATDASIGLVFIHLEVAHAPHAYDPKTGKFTLANSPIRGYLGSLALADLTLGKIRKAMEANALWDRTAILISSDHSYRSSEAFGGIKDHRVPFMLKLAGQKEGIVFDRPFSSLLSHDLVLGLLKEKIASADAALNWLAQQAAVFKPAPDR